MKTIGLLGGMSWQSSLHYYRLVNEGTQRRLGGLHSARCLLHSIDFAPLERLQHEGRWDEAADLLTSAAQSLERGGAELLVLCTNTMHKVADAIEARLRIPFLHIADPTAEAVARAGLRRVGLLGTRFTMEESFYKGRLEERHGLEVVVPSLDDRVEVHRVIYDELCHGRVDAGSRATFEAICARLVADGAQGIILGCTEIMMLLEPAGGDVPRFDTTTLHAAAAVEAASAG